MTVVYHDTFTGSGDLSTHAPDVGNVYTQPGSTTLDFGAADASAWGNTVSHLVLDGSGGLPAVTDSSPDFAPVLVASMLTTPVVQPYDLTFKGVVVPDSTNFRELFLVAGNFAATRSCVRLRVNSSAGTGTDARISLIAHDVGGTRTININALFTPTGSEQTFNVNVSASGVDVTIDGVSVLTSATVPADDADCIFVTANAADAGGLTDMIMTEAEVSGATVVTYNGISTASVTAVGRAASTGRSSAAVVSDGRALVIGTSVATVVALGLAASVGVSSSHVDDIGRAASRGISVSTASASALSASVGTSSASVTGAGKGGLSVGSSHSTVTTSGLSAAKGIGLASVSAQGLVARLGTASASFTVSGLSSAIGTSNPAVATSGLAWLPHGASVSTALATGLSASIGASRATVVSVAYPSGALGVSAASVVATGLSASIGSSSSSISTSGLLATSGQASASVLASGLSASVGTSAFSFTGLGIEYSVETIPTVGGVGWTANTDTFAMSRYTNYAFNSIAMVDGYPVALGAAGAYILTGNDDDGTDISASITTDFSDTVDGKSSATPAQALRRSQSLYVARSGGEMQTTIRVADKRGVEFSYSYDIPGAGADLATWRGVLGRGQEYRYSSITLANVDGSDFVITEAKHVVDLLRRRI